MFKARGIRDASVPTKARLTYFQDKSLTLDLQYKADSSWTNCFTLTAPEHNIAMPSVSYLGFSGETGELSDNHDIISVSASNLYVRPPRDDSAGSGRQAAGGRVRKPYDTNNSSWGWVFIKFFLFFVAIAVSYVGWTLYRANQQHSRF
jgi:lectin, mannose-binding 2